MDLVLRLAEAGELPEDHTWMILERDDGRVLVVVDRHINDAHLCTMWRLINPPEAHAESA